MRRSAAARRRAVPLKWRLLDSAGAPATDLVVAAISVTSLGCETAAATDQIEQTATTGSGLQNLGDGYYQLNWKTAKSYARTCKTMHLDLGQGVTYDALFEFTK
jgi:glutamine cyclotransferase